jgi:hypothetical protein
MNPITVMKVSFFFPLIFLSSFLFSQQAETLESKGSIIIASLEGQVTVVNNTTQEPLPASQVKAGGLLVDGHTVKTGPASKVILLLSNGTVSTIKSNSALNIKKFTQEKFDPGRKKLSDMKGEPSSSQTVMDLELGDMVFDVKKLDKRSSFNIESPVGTAGIRGTSGQIGVMANNGATNLNINMFKGSVATRLRGSDISTLVRQGQSFSAGISAAGVILPPTLGKVPTTLLASIEADLEASEGATGVTSVGDPSVPASEGGENVEDEAPSEEELQEQDAEQAAAAKGLGADDNGSEEAVAMNKAGLIDLDDPDQLAKVETYAEVTNKGAELFKKKQDDFEKKKQANSGTDGARRYRRATGNGEDIVDESGDFLTNIVGNLDDVVDITKRAEDLGAKDEDVLTKTVDNADKAKSVKKIFEVADKAAESDPGQQAVVLDGDAVGALLRNAEQADVIADAVATEEPQDSASPGAAPVVDTQKLAGMFDVVKRVDKRQKQAKADAVGSTDGGKTLPPEIIEDITNAVDREEVDDVVNFYAGQDVYADLKDAIDKLGSKRKNDLDIFDSDNFTQQLKIQVAVSSSADLSEQDKQAALESMLDLAANTSAIAAVATSDSEDSAGLAGVVAAANVLTGRSGGNEAESAGQVNEDFVAAVFATDDSSSDSGDSLFADLAILADVTLDNDSSDDFLTGILTDATKPDGEGKKKSTIKNLGNVAKKAKSAGAEAAKSFAKVLDVKSDPQQGEDSKSIDDIVSQAEVMSTVADTLFASPDESQDNAGDIFENISEIADAYSEFTEVLGDQSGTEAPTVNVDFIKNIAKEPKKAKNVASVVKKAKKAGVEDVSLLQNIAANTEQAEKMEEVFETLGGENIDPDAAKNILGNAAEIDVIDKALDNAKKAGKQGSDLADFAKKDISEQKAVNDIVKELEESGAGAESFLTESFDDALQVKQALDDGVLDAENLVSGKSFADQLKDNSLTELAKRFGFNVEFEGEATSLSTDEDARQNVNGVVFEELFLDVSTRSEDLLFALKFVGLGSSQEAALLSNIDKLDSIMYLSNRFRPIEITDQLSPNESDRISNTNAINSSRLNAVFDNLDVVDSLQELVFELSVFPDRLDIVFQNADLAPSILSTYRDYEKGNQYLSIERMFSSSDSLISTLSNDGINKLLDRYPSYSDEIEANAEIAAEISSLVELVGDERAYLILSNLNYFDSIESLVFRSNNQEGRLNALFTSIENSPGNTPAIQTVSNEIAKNNIPGGQDFLFNNLDQANILAENLDAVPAIIDVSKRYYKSSEKMEVVFANPDKAVQLRDLSKDLQGKADDLLANVDQLDVIGELATEFANDTEKMSVVFANSAKASQLRDLSKDLQGKGDDLLANVDQLDVIGELATEFANDTEKMSVVFANSGKASQLRDLSKDLQGKGDDLLANVDQLDVIGELATEFANDTEKMSVVFANSGKAVQLRDLSKDLQGKGDDLLSNVDQLDVIGELAAVFANDTEKMSVVFANSGKASQLRDLSKDLEGKGDELLANVDQLDVIGELATEFANDTEKMSVVFANSGKAVQLRDLSKDLEGKGDDLLANVDQLDVIGDLASEFDNDLSKLDVVFENPQNAGKIRDLSKRFGSKHNEILSAVDNIDEVENLANRFEGDSSKIETLFDNVDRVVDIKTLADKFDDAAASGVEVKPEDVLDNLEHLDDVLALDQKFDGEDGKLMNLYLNPEKAGSLKGLIDRYDQQAEDLIFNLDALDSIEALEQQVDGDSAQMAILLANPEKSNQIKTLSDRIGGNEVELLENVDQLDVIEDLTNTFDADSDSMEIIFANSAKASKLSSLSKDLSGKEQDLLDNIDQIDVIGDLVVDYGGDPEKMDVVFRNPSKASKLRDLNDDPDFEGQSDDLLSNIANVDNFEKDPRLLGFAKNHPEFFKLLLSVGEDLGIKPEDIDFDLLTQLVTLDLQRDELSKVLSDLNIGPDSDGPDDVPPSNDDLDDDFDAVSLLESHNFAGEIPSDLVLSEDKIRASSLFQETLDIFDALSAMDEYSTASSSESPSSTTGTELPMGIIGGVNIKFSSGDYDLSDLGYVSYAIAASESLTIEGSLGFSSTSNNLDELIFISADTLSVAEGTSIDFSGRSLGLGSFDTIDIINVDLHAEEEIGIRSLDSIVINNSDFATRGSGADFVHLMAAANIELNNLRFSEQVKQITMEAMTINLSNLNFPAGSTVNLNSAYGGIDGVYPNFGSSAVGRVNFIENVKYNSHLLNTRAAFDAYGQTISIGVSGL